MTTRKPPVPMPRRALGRSLQQVFWVALALLAGLPIAAADDLKQFDCVIIPSLIVKIGSPVVGLLDDVKVRRGDIVSKGELIASLEAAVERAAAVQIRARAQSKAEIELRAAQLKLAKKKYHRAATLYRRRVVSQQALDELLAEVDVARAHLEQAVLRKKLAELELRRGEAILKQREIHSSVTGIVTERALSAGEYVHQEAHIVTIAVTDPLYVDVFLPGRFYPSVKRGMVGTIVPAKPIGGKYRAKVIVVDKVFDAASDTFGVRLELSNPNNVLPAGVRCTVSFEFDVNSVAK
jgi:RND family efflux transporter MFP subunit